LVMLVEVNPLDEKHYAIFIDGDPYFRAKSSFDCDFAVKQLRKILDAEFDLHPELRLSGK
jgi:hypothetical protein